MKHKKLFQFLSILIMLFIAIPNTWGETIYYGKVKISSGSLSKGTSGISFQFFKNTSGTITNVNTITITNASTNGDVYYQTNNLSLTELNKSSNWTSSTSDAYMRSVKFTSGTNATLSLGSITATKITFIGKADATSKKLTIGGVECSSIGTSWSNYDFTKSGNFTGDVTISQTANFTGILVIETSSGGGGESTCVDLKTTSPSATNITISTSGGSCTTSGYSMGSNNHYISFNVSNIGTLKSVTFKAKTNSSEKTIGYGYEASSTVTASVTSSSTNEETYTISNIPSGKNIFTIIRNGGTGTLITNVCFEFNGSTSTYAITGASESTTKGTVASSGTVTGLSGTTKLVPASNVVYLGSSGSANKFTATPNSGYAFDKWKIGSTVLSSETNVTAATTVTAYFVTAHTVTFNANGYGTAPSSITNVKHGSTISAPTAPTATGYAFGGWYKEAACTNAWDFSTDVVNADITLYAKWTYTGSIYPVGEAFWWGWTLDKSTMTSDGAGIYTWSGWLTTNKLFRFLCQNNAWKPSFDAGSSGTEVSLDQATSLTKGDTENNFKVSSSAASGYYTITLDLSNHKACKMTITAMPTKRIYMKAGFDGWKNAKYAVFNITQNTWPARFMTEGTGCYAGYYYDDVPTTCEKVILGRFNTSKSSQPAGDWSTGAVSMWNQTEDITLGTNDLIETKYYNENEPDKGKAHCDLSTFALAKYSITFTGNGNTGGSMTDVANIDCGSDVTLANNGYTKTGYNFSKWKDASNNEYNNQATISNITSNIALTAQWTAKNYTVTLDKNDHGSAGGSFKVDFGATSITNFNAATPAATYAVDGYYTAASGGSKVIDASGNIQSNVSGWTTSDGKWNKDGSSLKLYAHYTDAAPTSVTISGDAQYCPGQTISLSAVVEGARSGATYSWKRGDTQVGTSSTLSISTCTSSNAGSYTCTVTNGSASKTSEAYVVKVYTLTLVEGSSSQSIDFTHQSGKIGSFTKTLNENFTYGIKVSDGCGNWYGNQGTMKNTNSTNWPLDKNDNMNLLTSCTGTYTFTLDYSYSHDFGSGAKYLALTVTYPDHNQVADYPIYFENTGTGTWTNAPYYRIGAASTLCSEPMTKVPGTDRLYTTNTKEYNSFLAWHICNNTGWTGDNNSVYRTKTNDEQSTIAITNSIAFDKDIVPEGGVTIVPGSQHSTGNRDENKNCEFYSYSKTNGLLSHTATIGEHTNGTITVEYTDVDNTAKNFTSGNQSLAHTCILTITGTPAQGYKLATLTVNDEAFTSGSTHVLSADATIAATFTAKTYNITYKDQNDQPFSGTHGQNHPTTHTYGSETQLVSPTKTGYTFDGWFGNKECTGDKMTSVPATTYTADFTLYAKWTAKNYTLHLKANDGASPATADINKQVTYDAGFNADGFTPHERTGYTLDGYFTAASSGDKIIGKDGSSWKFEGGTHTGYTESQKWKGTEDKDLYAHWTAKQTTITLNKNGGSGNGSAKATFGSSSLSNVSHATAASGYTLEGYYTAATNGDKIITSSGSLVANTTYTDADGKWKSESSTLTLYAHYTSTVVPVTGVTLNKSTTSIAVGGSETLTATVTPNNATDKTVSWQSSDESVATVSNAGLVTAVAAGTATITVTTTDGGKTATCTVTVTGGSVETCVTFGSSSDKDIKTNNTYTFGNFTIVTSISDYNDQRAKFKSAGSDYIEIKNESEITSGKINGYRSSAVITYSSNTSGTSDVTTQTIVMAESSAADRDLTVPEGTKYIKIENLASAAKSMYFYSLCVSGSSTSCTDPELAYSTTAVTKKDNDNPFTNTLTNSHNVAVTYNSSKTDVATVDANGLVTIKKVGSTVIKASSARQTVDDVTYCADEASYTLTVNSTCTTPTISDISVTKSVVAETSGTSTASVTSNYPDGVSWSVAPTGIFTLGTPSTTSTTASVVLTRVNNAEGSVTITAKVKGDGTTYCGDEISKTTSISASSKPAGAYDITKASGIIGGTIEIRQNGEEVTYAKPGQLITLTATPASGKTFDAWTVYKTGDNSTKVTVTNNTFVMPNYAVTVSATFKAASGGTGTSCNEWGYGTDHHDVPTQSADVTIGNMTLVNRGCKSASKKAGDLFSGSEVTTAITLGGKSQFVAGHLNGAEIKTVSFSAQGEGKNVFIAFCNEQNFIDNDSTHLSWYSLDTCHDVNNPNHHANARAFVTNNKADARITYTVGAPAGAKSFAIARNFVDIDSLKPEYVPTAAWQSSGSRALYYIKACGGSAAAVATPPAGIVRDTTINCGTTASIKLTAYGSLENNNTWYWQTSETGTDKTHSGATYSVSKAGTYYVRSYCVNPSNANEESWSAARSITVPSSAWTPLPEISDLCGSTGASTITYTKNEAGSKLYVEASNTSKVVWYSNESASTTGGTFLCNGVLSGGKYYTTNAVSTTTVGNQYYYCEIFNGTCAITSPLVTVTVEEQTKTTKFSLVMKDQLADQSVAAKTSMEISSSLATIVNGTAALENMSSADGKAQILSDHINLAGSDGLVVVNLDYPLAQGDVITITNRIADNANQYALTATKERSTAIVTTDDTYTIPASSPLIGIKTLYVWRSTTAISFIKTINVEIEGTLPCKGPKFTSITADHTTIGKGSTATLTAVVTPGVSGKAISYQWYKDNEAISGATSDTYAFATTASTAAETYNFYCIATEANCSTAVKSTGVSVMVTDCETPTIEWSTAPTNLRVGEGNGEATVETNRVAGVVYTSSNNAIATVSGNGTGKVTITPVTAGTVTITATVTGDGAVVCSGTEEVTQKITIAAAYEKYTIGYDFSMGGAFESGVTVPTTVIRNEWNMIPVPKRSGYDFAGWTVSAGLSTDGYYNTTGSGTGTHIVYTCDVCTAGSNTAVYFKNIGVTGGNVTLTPKWVAECDPSTSGEEKLDSTTYNKTFTNSDNVTGNWSATKVGSSTMGDNIACIKIENGQSLTHTFTNPVHVKSIKVIHSFNAQSGSKSWSVVAKNKDNGTIQTSNQSTSLNSKKERKETTIAFDYSAVKTLTFTNSAGVDMYIAQIIITVVTKEASSGTGCYSFTYHASVEGATGKTQDDHVYSEGDQLQLLKCTYLYDNHYCTGWATTRGGEKVYDEEQSFEMPANNVELFAVWAEDSKTEPTVTWTPDPFPTTVYPGSKFDFTVQTNTDAKLSVANLSAQNATLTNVQLNTTTKTFSATCNVPADATTDPVITLATATGTSYRQNVSNKELTLQTCVGSGYQTIFYYNAKSTETALGTYAAEGGTAILSGKIMNGNEKQTIGGQDYIQMRAGSNWVFQLDGDATFLAGDVITFTFAADAENARHTGVDLYLNLFNTNVPAGQTGTIRYVVQGTKDGISEYIRGTNTLMMERANQYMKFGTVTVQRAMASTGEIQEPTLKFKDKDGNIVEDGSTITKKVNDIPFTISAYSNSVGVITYASYDEGVTTVDQSGEVASPTANGQTVITATVAAAGCYNSKTIFYKLVVNSVDCDVIPQITTEPTPQTKLIGETVELTVVAKNADTYQWYQCADTEESDTIIIDGATSATYSFTAKEVGRKYYFCKVSSSCRNTVKTEPNFVEINPLPYTITYTAGVENERLYTETDFTANKTTTEPTYITNLSNYFFVNGAAIQGAANGTMSSTIKIPSTRTETNYTGFNFNVLESYYLTVSKCSLNVAAVGTTGIQVQAILSDNHDHMISSAIKTITEGVDQSVAIEFPNLDVQLVDQVTMKILAWYDDANAFIRIGEVTGIDGEIYSLPEPTISWTSVPKDGAVGKDMLIAAESNNTLNKITYTSSNTAVATISDVEDVDAKRLSYVAAGTSTISASIKGDGINYFAKTVTISQPITVTTAASETYTVTCFTSDGSKIYATYTQQTKGEQLSFMEPVNEGYTFIGWYNSDNVKVIDKGATYAPTADINVYAHWTPITYHIAYTLNGGEQCDDQPTEYNIESDEVTFCSPERTGFTFLGWYNNADFTGDVVTSIAKGSHGDVNLYARWQAKVESACINFGSWLFENNMTVGQKPAHAVSTTGTTYSAFSVDQINFSSQKITFENGTGEYGGWKINTKGATISFCVDNDCAVSIRVGQLKSDVTITYTDGTGNHNATLKANTTNSFSVKGETTVTLTIADSKTVVLKEITVTDPCSVEPAYTIIRKHFDKKQTVNKTEIGSITLAGPGVTYSLKGISGDGSGLTATFDDENGKMYIAGETDNLTRKTITLNVTYTFQNDCNPKKTFDVVIPVDIYAGNPKLAFIIDGEQDGAFDAYNTAHAEGTELFEKLKQNFDVYPINCYATIDEDRILKYYRDTAKFDILLMTDYPRTDLTKTINKKKYSYSNAVGCMVDVKPILTFETFVANLDNWHIASNPKSPEGADATNKMKLLCNANEILNEEGFGVGEVITMADQLPSPSLQGFIPKEAPDFVFIATIPRYSHPDSTALLINCCERQVNIKARMVMLGMQSNTYEVISEKGYQAVRGLLNYLLKDENIPDCSLIFHGKTSTSWQTAANWEGETIPSELSPVRIDAPCEVDIIDAKAGTVKINQKKNDEEVQLNGSLTINANAALTVTKFVRTMTDKNPEPHATAVSDLYIKSASTGNGALIFDNANGDAKAVVEYYSISSGTDNGAGGLTNAKWQWMATPFNDVKDVQHNYYGAWMRRYDNATHKWIDMYNGCSMTPFGGYELTQYGDNTYVMQGTLVATTNQTIKLEPYLNVIGNSWTAPINISQFTTDDFGNAEATIVMINTGTDVDGSGTVTVVDDAKKSDVRDAGTYVSIPINVATEVEQFKVIPSMQSFQVRAGGEGGSLTLNYDRLVRTSNVNIQPMRAPGRAASVQNKENGINERLRIYVQGSKYGDYIYLFQHDETTMDFDNGWDGRKYTASNDDIPILMARTGSTNWQISTQPQLAGTQIAFYQGEDNIYTIGFRYSGYETLWFYDNVTDQYTEINDDNTYVFTSNTTKLQKRFEIRDYNPYITVVPTKVDEKKESHHSDVQKIISHEKLFIISNGRVYNAQGKKVK